jgi:hypothetical protein
VRPTPLLHQYAFFHRKETAMADQPTVEGFPAELPRGVWAKKLPWKLGTITFVRSLMVDNIT